jgi:RsiW-degrading membrane proteinase PrsW (M82 family)
MSEFIQIFGSIILASLPAIVWGYIFYNKNPESRKFTGYTFILGALAVFPILIYKFLWQYFPWINAFQLADKYQGDQIVFSESIIIPLGAIITFMFVGIIEEIMKFLAVQVVDNDNIMDIDDAIEFFVIAALGFSFTENILYFYSIWTDQGPQNLLLPFLFRSAFSTFAHIMFSGIFGYYYGIAHFAGPVLQQEIQENRNHWTLVLHKIFNWRQTRMFHQEKILEGLFVAIGLHAIFNIFLEMNLTIMIAPFLVSGYVALNYLFTRKENHKQYGKLLKGFRNHPHPKSHIYFERKPIHI